MRKNTIGSLIWLRMMRFTHQCNLLSNDFLKQFDLTTAQFDVLVQVSEFGPLTQAELAERATLTAGGISRMLTRLEKEGWISRERDWKIKTISITERGETKLQEAFQAQLDFQTSFFEDSLTQEEQKQLLTLTSKVQKESAQRMKEKGDLL
ncbi:MAG TPA: MarR family transcriptional regulator [Pseudogracilibacillus sp.]|nr:MarR family transcriptional regulator [Pseudogracilibacillus sp.]